MKLRNIKLFYSFFIVVLYFVFGILLLFKYLVWREVPNISLGIFGVVVLLYGLFRGYRTYMEYVESKKEEDATE